MRTGKPKRQQVRATLKEYKDYGMPSSLPEFIAALQELQQENPTSSIQVELRGYHGYDGDVDAALILTGVRDETDEELAARLKAEAGQKAVRDRDEREQYERLKAKFEPK